MHFLVEKIIFKRVGGGGGWEKVDFFEKICTNMYPYLSICTHVYLNVPISTHMHPYDLNLNLRRVFVLGRTLGLEESIAEEYSTYKDIVQVNLKGLIQSAMKSF